MEFFSHLTEEQRNSVWAIIMGTVPTETKFSLLEACCLDRETLHKAKMFLLEGEDMEEVILRSLCTEPSEANINQEESTSVNTEEEPIENDNIMAGISASEKRTLAEFLLQNKFYTPLISVLLKETIETKKKFVNWFKKQEDYDEAMVRPIVEDLRAFESGKRTALRDVLKLMSSDQKKVLLCLMIKTRQWNSCDTLIGRESQETQTAFVRWKSQPSTTYPEEDDEYFAPPRPGEENCNVEPQVEDTAVDPDEWSPSFGHNFFEKFPSEMNIVVLGETGVGKSSFINGLANHLTFPNIHVAKENCAVMIEAHFTMLDQELKPRRIVCKPTIKQTEQERSNERTNVAKSSTQEPKAYQFTVGQGAGQKTIRIIDTPGIGDTDGIVKDGENFRKILTYLSNYREIHAILILLKANEQRLTIPIRFCLDELFTHLHVSARQNVAFCFTHARQTFYEAGDTQALLEAHLQTTRNHIPLNDKTLFYFDSESFRFVCAWKEGVTFTEDEVEDFDMSWQHSVKETFRLFAQVAMLPSHKTEETLGVNSLRQIVFAMARPMTEMAKLSAENARLIQKRIDEVKFLMQTGKDLEGKLNVEQVSLEVETLDKPRTVCAKCVEHVPMVEGNSSLPYQTFYKTTCHDNCCLEGVQRALYPNEALKQCWAFQEDETCCKVCKCPWDTHLHITYNLKKKVTTILDTSAQDRNLSRMDKARNFIKKAEEEKAKLEQQRDMIQSYCAEFGAFLRANSLMRYNDSYTEYVNYLITESQAAVAQGSSEDLLKELRSHQQMYNEHIKLLEGQGRVTDKVRTTEEIKKMVNDLKRETGTILEEIQTLEWMNIKKQNEDRAHIIPLNGGWVDKRYHCPEPGHKKKPKNKRAEKGFFGTAKSYFGL